MDSLQLKALGKINLGLDVLGTREDGYHEVQMVMQSIYLYDGIFLEKTKEQGIQLETNLRFLPVNDKNIAYKAAKLLIEDYKLDHGIHIKIAKHIPVSGGMGGGSTNAAAVLFGMNRMFELGLSRSKLMEYGLMLGADVPYCILRGTVLAEGIGEVLTPLRPMPPCTVLIAKLPFSVSTRRVYEEFDQKEIHNRPDMKGLLRAIENGDLQAICSNFGNVLEEVTIPRFPTIQEVKDSLFEKGALGALMSGSGPTVFGIFESRKIAKAAANYLKEKKIVNHVFVTNVHHVGGKGYA